MFNDTQLTGMFGPGTGSMPLPPAMLQQQPPIPFGNMPFGSGVDGSMQGLFGQKPPMPLPFGLGSPQPGGQVTTGMGMPPMMRPEPSGMGSGNPFGSLLSSLFLNPSAISALIPLLSGLGGNMNFYSGQPGIPSSPSGPVTSPLSQPSQTINNILHPPAPVQTQPVARRPEPQSQPTFGPGMVGGRRRLPPLLMQRLGLD